MLPTLNDILPEPVSEANEAAILALIRKKAVSPARIAVMLLHAMEERFGSAAREVVTEMSRNRSFPPRENPGDPSSDLHEFCDRMDLECVGSHEMRRIADEPDRIAYEITGCLWADIFRELGEPELGRIYCSGDEPATIAYNPALGFERTQVLMDGDDTCDHVFYVKKEEEEPGSLK